MPISQYKSMENLSWHSNQSAWATAIKSNMFVEANVMNMYANPLMISEEKIFEYFFENLLFMLPWQQFKFSDLDKIHMNCRGLLKKYFCKKI